MARLAVSALAGAVVLLAAGVGSGASRGAASGPTRFLVTVASSHYSVQRSEIVGSDGHLIRLVVGNSTAVASPNRRFIAWDGKGGIHVENVDGSGLRLLVKVRCAAGTKGVAVEGCGDQFAWSSDSRHLVFQASHLALSVVSIASGTTRQVVAPSKHVSYTPVGWSVPMNAILFALDDVGGANGIGCCRENLLLARPTGTDRRTIYAGREPHDTPAASWSPDGRWIAFTTDGRDLRDPRLAIVDERTGRSKTVRSYTGWTARPVWSPDSTRFATGSYQGPIGIHSTTGAKLATLPPARSVPLFWTRAGIYFTSGSENPDQLFRISPEGGPPQTVFTLPAGRVLLSAEPL